jgi:hypothetical protein
MHPGKVAIGLALLFWLSWACAPGSDTVVDGTGGATNTSTDDSTTDTTDSPASSPSSSSVGGAAGNGGAGGCDLMSPNTCETAEVLMEVDGDQGNEQVTIKGVGSKWFQIKVAEASNLTSAPSFTATLISAMGTDYDLFMRRGDDNGPDCSFTPLQATGMPETLSQCWPDGLGGDDSRHLSFEIVHVSGGSCAEAAQWELTVRGNTSGGACN